MSIPREELYTYRVEWSEEDQEFVGTVAEFPSLSCLADSSLEALSGIQQVVLQAIDILEEEETGARTLSLTTVLGTL